MRILLALLALFIAGFAAETARAASTDIQMLPPTGFAANASRCGTSGIGVGVLYWDGVTAIHCIPGFSGDASGNVSVNTGALTTFNALNSNGSLYLDNVGPLNGQHATALEQLVGASCAASGSTYQVLTRVNGLIQCTNVTDIVGPNGPMGQTWLSACPVGTVLTSLDGLNFTCVALSVPGCPGGTVMTAITNGVPVCAAQTFACPGGQVLQSVSGGAPVCVPQSSVPNCTYPALLGQDGAGTWYCMPVCPASAYFSAGMFLGQQWGDPDGCAIYTCQMTGWVITAGPNAFTNPVCYSGGGGGGGGGCNGGTGAN